MISSSLLKLMSIELVMPYNHLTPFSSCPQSFPASGAFPVSQLEVLVPGALVLGLWNLTSAQTSSPAGQEGLQAR